MDIETETEIYRRRFPVGIGSHGNGGWKFPRSAICKLEKQESWWHNSVQVWRLENQRGCCCNPQSKVKILRTQGATSASPRVQRPENQDLQCPREGKDGCPSSRRERGFALPPHFFSIRAATVMMPAHADEGRSSLLSLLDQTLTSSGNTSQTHPEQCLSRHSCGLPKLTQN